VVPRESGRSSDADDALGSLNQIWDELNERFDIRMRRRDEPLRDVGLYLDGQRGTARSI
jgi:hypothetical protein